MAQSVKVSVTSMLPLSSPVVPSQPALSHVTEAPPWLKLKLLDTPETGVLSGLKDHGLGARGRRRGGEQRHRRRQRNL